MFLTTTEAAALLTERGYTDRDGGPVKPDTVKHRCAAGTLPGAHRVGAPRRGYWMIPEEALEAWGQRKERSDKGQARRKVGMRVKY